MMENMRVKYVGFVGSGKYKRKDIVINKLEEFITPDMIVVSGRSPRNNYDNVDIWAENWAYENCENHPRIHPPLCFTTNGFFARNKLIAEDSQVLFLFINKGQMKSGAWNTLKWFLIKEQTEFYTRRYHVIDEHGEEWTRLPPWTQKYTG